MSIERVLVVGAGQMGSGIAQAMAQAGLTVTLSDVCEDLVVKGRNRIEKALSKSVEKNKLTREQKAAIIERVSGVVTLDEAAANVDLAIEAAAEKLDVKSEIFETLDERCPARTIFASNTSSLSITTLAARTRRAGQVIGMHFFNPSVMNLVEVVKGLGTTAATITEINALVRRLGKTAVEVTDTPGFCGNRIMIPMINEAVFALMEGVASVEDIDNVAKLGFNHPIGPSALSDLIGNDTVLSIMEVLFDSFGDSSFAPARFSANTSPPVGLAGRVARAFTITMVKGRLQRSDDQRQRSIRKLPSLAHGSGLMASLMQLNRRFIEITAGDGAEAILGHIDADAVCHAARFVHDPSLRMRARSAHATVRAFGQSDASRALVTRGLSGPEGDRAGLRPRPRRLRAGWQLRDTRGAAFAIAEGNGWNDLVRDVGRALREGPSSPIRKRA